MKRLSLICFLSACAFVAEGCSNGAGVNINTGTGGGGGDARGGGSSTGTGGGSAGIVGAGKGGAAGSGSAAKTGGADAGAGGIAGGGGNSRSGGTAGSACPGQQPLTGSQCRWATECPGNGRGYYCSTDPGSISSACATPLCVTPPRHDCTVDTDCPTGDICLTSIIKCCNQPSKTCHVSCNAAGVTCAAGTTCSPGTKGADDYGCAPLLCNAGYTCPTGFQCAAGALGTDAHGCEALPCSQTSCPANFVCPTTPTYSLCAPKRCSTDCDCDSGFCVGGTCASVLGTCVVPRL